MGLVGSLQMDVMAGRLEGLGEVSPVSLGKGCPGLGERVFCRPFFPEWGVVFFSSSPLLGSEQSGAGEEGGARPNSLGERLVGN